MKGAQKTGEWDQMPNKAVSKQSALTVCTKYRNFCAKKNKSIQTPLISELDKYTLLLCFNPNALRKAKIVYNFGLSECNRVKRGTYIFRGSNSAIFSFASFSMGPSSHVRKNWFLN